MEMNTERYVSFGSELNKNAACLIDAIMNEAFLL